VVIRWQVESQERQASTIGEILEHGKIAIADMERLCPTVSRRTLQSDQKQLIDKGLYVETALTSTDPTKCHVLDND
jgi:hypothetical protein